MIRVINALFYQKVDADHHDTAHSGLDRDDEEDDIIRGIQGKKDLSFSKSEVPLQTTSRSSQKPFEKSHWI